nr:hypothetical protein [Tanacetum cinerariifolium]
DLSPHSTKYTSHALTQKVFGNMRRVGKGFSGLDTPLFEGMLVVQEVGEGGTDEVHVEDVNVAGVATKGIVSATDDVVPTAVDESSIPSPTPPTPPPQPSQDQPSTPQVYLTPPQSPQSSTTITSTLTTTFIGCWITNDPSLKPNGHMYNSNKKS